MPYEVSVPYQATEQYWDHNVPVYKRNWLGQRYTAGRKSELRTRQVTKYRQETRYREEQRTRQETRYRTEDRVRTVFDRYVPIFEDE